MLGGSKQQKFTLSHSGGQMSQIGITGLIPSCQQAHTPSRGFRGKPTFLPPPASGGCQHSLTHSRSICCLHGHTVFSFSACFESPSSLLCGHFFLLHLVLTQIIQSYPPISWALTIFTKIQHLQIPGIKTWYINIWMAHYNHISTFPLSILFYIICYYKSNRCLLKKIRIYG